MNQSYFEEDFTEENYRKLVKLAHRKYRFLKFEEYKQDGILWRHDIDFSVHRALRLAQIEREENASATYFVYLHSAFYNVFEKPVYDKLKKIQKMGEIGLHFDMQFYDLSDKPVYYLEEKMYAEKVMLEDLLETRIKAVSFHNPTVGKGLDTNDEIIAGMVNAYCPYIKNNFGYCSDSNGYWRFKRLEDVLRNSEQQRLHVLTHPGWWQQDMALPRERVERAVYGRAKGVMAVYDEQLEFFGRKNISRIGHAAKSYVGKKIFGDEK